MMEYERPLTDYEKALVNINRAYEDEDSELYENRIEHASKRFKKPAWQVEDDATDVRYLGIDGN